MTLRLDALSRLEHLPTSPLRDRFVAHLEAHEDGCYRSCSPDHITASTLVLSHDHRHALLTLHAKAQEWFQFGGHCEQGDATLAGAALREATEESGLSDLVVDPAPIHLDAHHVPFCGGGSTHLDVRFLAVAPQGAEHAVSEESLDVKWWPLDRLPTREESMQELVRSALVRLGVPISG